MIKFRVDFENKLNESPTLNSVVHLGKDRGVARGNYYRLDICHVNTFPHGRGFMPQLRFRLNNGLHQNGNVEIGTDETAYQKAVNLGLSALEESERAFAEIMKMLKTEAK